MAFPTDLTNAVDDITDAKAEQLNNLEAKVGIDSSTVKNHTITNCPEFLIPIKQRR